MEVMVPRDEMLVIHFNKVGIRQVKKNEKNLPIPLQK